MSALRLAFAGTPDFAARHLGALLDSRHELVAVLSQPDRRAGRGKQPRPSAVKEVALAAGVSVLQPATLRTPDAVEMLAALDLDCLVVVAYGLLLPQNVLDLPRFGCLNVHGSLLPRWRGAAPIQRAIEAGDRESGITIMQMDAGLDTGPMLAHGPCSIAPLATSADLYEQLAVLGPPLLIDVLDDLPAFLARAQTQDDAEANYAAKIEKSEALLDWQRPAAELARRIRAFNPAPGCFSFIDDHRVKFWMAQPQPATSDAVPGTIVSADDRGVAVACAEGELLVHTLQIPGSRAMPIADLLRGNAELISPGRVFTQQPVS